jgi:hypothetical protein
VRAEEGIGESCTPRLYVRIALALAPFGWATDADPDVRGPVVEGIRGVEISGLA